MCLPFFPLSVTHTHTRTHTETHTRTRPTGMWKPPSDHLDLLLTEAMCPSGCWVEAQATAVVSSHWAMGLRVTPSLPGGWSSLIVTDVSQNNWEYRCTCQHSNVEWSLFKISMTCSDQHQLVLVVQMSCACCLKDKISIYLSIYPSIFILICPSVSLSLSFSLSISISFFPLSLYRSRSLSLSLSLSFYLSLSLSIYIYIYI